MAGRVVVVGSVNVDLVVTAPRLPAPGETVLGGTFARHHGGKGANQAVAAARLGAETLLVAALGDDDFGIEARASLRSERVDDRAVVMLAGVATGVALIVVGPDGENAITVAPGANAAMSPRMVEHGLGRVEIRSADIVLVGHEIPTAAAAAALRAGRGAGATTILNPAPARGLDATTLTLADVVTPNELELMELAGLEDEHSAGGLRHDRAVVAARALISNAGAQRPPVVLVSLGAAGAVLVTESEVAPIPAPSVDARDSTGAGDALNGALAAGLAGGLDLETAARRAVVAASLSTRQRGARAGMPTREEVDREPALRRA